MSTFTFIPKDFGKKKSKLPQALSVGEETFMLHMKARGLNPSRQVVFHAERNWRFDFCFIQERIAVEIDGGIYSRGRHTRGKGFEEDCEKVNAAVMLGYRVLRYSTEMVKSGAAERQVAQLMGVL